MKSDFTFKTATEAQNRVNELYKRKTELEEKKITLKNDLSQAMARGSDTSGIIAQIAAIDTELENLPAAIQIINKEVLHLQKAEDLKSAEFIASDLMAEFKKNILPELQGKLQEYFDWKQSARIEYLKNGTASMANDPFRAEKTTLRNMVFTLAEQTERSTKPAKKAELETVAPEPSPKFGKNVVVSNGRGPVQRIDSSNDSGDAPGQAESRHGLGIREVPVPGPRY
ncbi:hypothetical protein [Marispirochaeta sp.]|uniref:hypothetical protein n=1 Tax=Marispirochaeta sp. TaxID=2038653 RepID=UPI0029C62E73|nr:hypothetical protein [Marispirochaeta sp.]